MPPLSTQQKKIIGLIIWLLVTLISGFFAGCQFYGRYTEGGKTLEVGGTVEKPQPKATTTPGQ